MILLRSQPERDQTAEALKKDERPADGNAFLKRYSEHSKTYWKAGKDRARA